ncbi:hypothetical protein Taro_034486 [Colocasia esculenta]|uniref:Uncharacterized protein n=1 Tax=Colocasia esculenta TaxID=4460 RepID=A0A843W7S5_COLES|nr:hypothetical protein [Colocasia esculenta]
MSPERTCQLAPLEGSYALRRPLKGSAVNTPLDRGARAAQPLQPSTMSRSNRLCCVRRLPLSLEVSWCRDRARKLLGHTQGHAAAYKKATLACCVMMDRAEP